MKKIRNLILGGIQQKVFNLVLLTMVLMVAAYTAVIVYQTNSLRTLVKNTNDQQKKSITEISGEAMADVLNSGMGESTAMEAYISNNLFKQLSGVVYTLADYAQKLFADPAAYPRMSASLPEMRLDGAISDQLLTAEGVDLKDPELADKIGLMANMSDLMKAVYSQSIVDSCYIALPDGVMLLVDDHSSSKFDDKGNIVSIPMTERQWYQGAEKSGKLFFSDVTTDLFTGSVSIMCSLPVYRDGELAAVIGADLFLSDMAAAVADSGRNGGFVCIVNDHGHVVFSPLSGGTFQVRPDAEALDLREAGNADLTAFLNDAFRATTDARLIEADGETYYMCGSPIEMVGWTVISAVNKDQADMVGHLMQDEFDHILGEAQTEFEKGFSFSRQTMIVLILIVLAAGITAAMILARRIVRPLGMMTKRVSSLGGKDLQFFVEDAYRTGDEIEVLAESFAKLSEKTLRYVDQVQKVTAEKERIGAELNMATEIQASQLPRLFPAFPRRPEFDIFASMTPAKEVGGDFYDFFLVDDDHIGLVIADVSGKGVPAALFMMVSRVLIKSRLQNGETPGVALENVNNQLCEGNEAGFFVTVWVAVLEISTGKGLAANAGHEHPALRRAGGQFELITYRHSMAVATMEGLPFREHSFEMHPGDSLFVYTDGVAEATNAQNELFGPDRMLEALNREPDGEPVTILNHVMDGINTFVAGAQQFDDITMLCLKYYGPGGPETENMKG